MKRLAVFAWCVTFAISLGAAPPAAWAGEGALGAADGHLEAGRLDEAREAYAAILADAKASAEDRTGARLGLALLAKAVAVAEVTRDGATYEEITSRFDAATELLRAFVAEHPDHARADFANVEVGVTPLIFGQWIADLLEDPDEVQRRGYDAKTLADDALEAVDGVMYHFDDLRRCEPGAAPTDAQRLAAYYHAVTLYYRALVEPPCSEMQVQALEQAAEGIEAYLLRHDGELLALQAHVVLGRVWRRLAQCEEGPASKPLKYAKAVACFDPCIYADAESPEHLAVIVRAHLALAETAAEARALERGVFLGRAIASFQVLDKQHPKAKETRDGLRAFLAWADLEHLSGNVTGAIELAMTTAAYAVDAGEHGLARRARLKVVDYLAGSETTDVDPELLRFAAEELFLSERYAEAISFYERLAAQTSGAADAFVKHAWGALEHTAECHRRLGDADAQLAALKAIHEAWKKKLIPRKAGKRDDPNLVRALASRRTALALVQARAEETGEKADKKAADQMGRSILMDYMSDPRAKGDTTVAIVTREDAPASPTASIVEPSIADAPTLLAHRGPEPPSRPKPVSEVEDALRWLQTHASPGGGWEAAGFMNWRDGKQTAQGPDGAGHAFFDPGITGLALCAFLGAGYTHLGEHPYKETIANALRYLKEIQDAEGCLGSRKSPQYVYNHALGAFALVEAYGRTKSPLVRAAAQRALDFVALTRNPYFAWRYGVKPGDNDTSVTGWMMMPLQAARRINRAAVEDGKPAPLRIDEEAFDGIKAWIEKMTDAEHGRTGYVERGSGPIVYKGWHDAWTHNVPSDAPTAVAILARHYLGEKAKAGSQLLKAATLIADRAPEWKRRDGCTDMIYWYYGTLGLSQVGGKNWRPWKKALEKNVLARQRTDTTYGLYKGSWDPAGKWGMVGGRVYATALMAMCAQIANDYETICGVK